MCTFFEKITNFDTLYMTLHDDTFECYCAVSPNENIGAHMNVVD